MIAGGRGQRAAHDRKGEILAVYTAIPVCNAAIITVSVILHTGPNG